LEDEGISAVVVDSAANIITSKVAHFSNLVVAENNFVTRNSGPLTTKVLMHPNPVRDMLNIVIDEALEGEKTISVYNLPGQLQYSTNFSNGILSLDLSTLNPGMYLVKITDSQNRIINSGKFIKE
jgi:hypothetical protein